MQKLVKTQKLTNTPILSFGLIEENMELSHILLAVLSMLSVSYRVIWKQYVDIHLHAINLSKPMRKACEVYLSHIHAWHHPQ